MIFGCTPRPMCKGNVRYANCLWPVGNYVIQGQLITNYTYFLCVLALHFTTHCMTTFSFLFAVI